ncbi:hypothetical protein [Gimesia sp.]|uniref:hypothetical protein n=1 Tax=Gimesia sp. TaxID=2024833 RepID=UPI003A8C9B23
MKLQPDSNNQAIAALTASQAQSVALAGSEAYEMLQSVSDETMKQITEVQKVQAGLRNDIDKHEQNERIGLMEQVIDRVVSLEEKRTANTETEADKREKIRNKEAKKAEKEAKKAEKEAKELAKKLQEAENARVEGHKKAHESAVIVIQGLADMAEGAAKLGLVSEENFEKFAKNFNMVKEGIRVFKGITDVIWKTREALVALSAASNAQAAANELAAASNLKASTSAALAGGAQAAGRAAAGSGAKVAAGAAAGTGGGSVLAGTVIFAKLITIVAAVATVFLALTEGVKWLGRALGDTSDSAESNIGAFFSWRDAVAENEKSQEKLTKAEEARQRILDARTRFENQEALKSNLERDLRGAQNAVTEARSIAAGNGEDDSQRTRLTALEDVRAAEQAILDDRKKQEDRIAHGHYESLNNRERVMKDLEDAQGRLLEAEKSRLKVIEDQKKQINEQLKAEKEKVQVAKDALKSEKQRLLERYGRLDKAQQYRVNEISKKPAAQRTRQDIKDLEDAGLAGNIGANYYANAGAAAGGNQIINNLGLLDEKNQEVAIIRTRQQEKERELLRKQAEEDQTQAALLRSAEQRQRTVNARVGINADQAQINATDIVGYSPQKDQFVKELQKVAQDAKDASDNITQRSIELAQAMDGTLGSYLEALEELKRTIDKKRSKEKAYNK